MIRQLRSATRRSLQLVSRVVSLPSPEDFEAEASWAVARHPDRAVEVPSEELQRTIAEMAAQSMLHLSRRGWKIFLALAGLHLRERMRGFRGGAQAAGIASISTWPRTCSDCASRSCPSLLSSQWHELRYLLLAFVSNQTGLASSIPMYDAQEALALASMQQGL